MNPAITLPEATPAQRRRGRLQLILILAVVIAPMILASAMYQWRFWVPETRSYHGALIGNGQSRADLGIAAATETRWQLLVTVPQACDSACKELVFLARQIHIGLNRDVSRASHALAVNSATSALHIACLALELGPGDRLWTTPVTFVASANCGLYCGAEVDFVDIDPRTYNLCPQALERKLEQAEREGLHTIFTAAGFEWREPGCVPVRW